VDLYDLILRLRYERIDSGAISIGQPFREGTYCLEKARGDWRVFAIERGQRVAESVFENECSACQAFLAKVLQDTTTRQFEVE
jgi:hypothetical protein